MNAQRPSEGLRERKRAALQTTIERAALDLALEHGYEHITIDMICEASMISQRTFFNYFGTKEGVIFGSSPDMPSEEAIQAFVQANGTSVLEDLLQLIGDAMTGDGMQDHSLQRDRRTVIHRTPELAAKEQLRVTQNEDAYVRIILERFTTQGREPRGRSSLEDEARMVTSLAATLIYQMSRRWPDRPPSSAKVQEFIQESIALIRSVAAAQ